METNTELSLIDVCYEHIKDTFYYGIFGDFKLVVDTKTGFFNATKLCRQGGKEYRQWMRLEKSKKLFTFYKSKSRCEDSPPGFYEINGDNKHILSKEITGTYVPKELILDIASWISVEFYDKCNNVIINYFIEKFKKMDENELSNKIKEMEEQMSELLLENEDKSNIIKEKDDKLDRLMDMMRNLGISMEEVKDQNHGLKKDLKQVKTKLNIAVEDRAPLPEDKSKQERFVLIKRNDDEYYPYYTIRAQNDYTKRKLKTEYKHFPKLEIILDFKCNPNSKSLYTRIKENLKSKNVVFKGNNIELDGSKVTEEELVEEMEKINDKKRQI